MCSIVQRYHSTNICYVSMDISMYLYISISIAIGHRRCNCNCSSTVRQGRRLQQPSKQKGTELVDVLCVLYSCSEKASCSSKGVDTIDGTMTKPATGPSPHYVQYQPSRLCFNQWHNTCGSLKYYHYYSTNISSQHTAPLSEHTHIFRVRTTDVPMLLPECVLLFLPSSVCRYCHFFLPVAVACTWAGMGYQGSKICWNTHEGLDLRQCAVQ